ncbi:hypothetical protein ACJX0J_025500, partial [Zea mays]
SNMIFCIYAVIGLKFYISNDQLLHFPGRYFFTASLLVIIYFMCLIAYLLS